MLRRLFLTILKSQNFVKWPHKGEKGSVPKTFSPPNISRTVTNILILNEQNVYKIKSSLLDINEKGLAPQIRDHEGSKVFHAQLLTDGYFVIC